MVTKKYRYATIKQAAKWESYDLPFLQVNYYKMVDAMFGHQNNKSFLNII